MPDLRDDGRIKVVLSLGLGLLIEGAHDVDDGEHSAVRHVTLLRSIVIYLLELCLRSLSFQFLNNLLAIVTVSIRVCPQGVIYHYLCRGYVDSDDEPMLIGDIDQKDKSFIGKAVVGIALAIDEYIRFGVGKETGPIIIVVVVIIGPLYLLQVLNDCRCDGVVQPLVLPQSLQDIVRDGAGILCLKGINPAVIQVSIVVTFADVPTALYDLAPKI